MDQFGDLDHFKLAQELFEAMRQANWGPEFVKKLIDPGNLSQVAELLGGRKILCEVDDIIDLAADAPLPTQLQEKHWASLKHERQSKWRFQPQQIKLFRSEGQVAGKTIWGEKLLGRAELKAKSLANACLLEWFRLHPQRIPVQWLRVTSSGQTSVCFPSTVYRDHEAHPCVRCLTQIGDSQWTCQSRRLKSYWSPNDFVAYIEPPVRP